MEDDLNVITTRLARWEIEYVERIAKEQHLDKATVYRQLLAKAIEQDRLVRAVTAVQEQNVTVTEAAEMAGMPLLLFIDELIQRKIRRGLGAEEFREGLRNLRKGLALHLEK